MAGVMRKGWLTALVLLGLVAGLLGGGDRALGNHPDTEKPDYEAVYSACVGPALESFGFEDAAGLGSEDAINCLAHYGVTLGRTPTMFAPRETVSRWQMALFMSRAASAAGIVLENPATDQGFTDIGGLSEAAQNAVNGLAKAGIMPGVSTTEFSPNSSVTRSSMADLLDAFLSRAAPGEGGFNNGRYQDVSPASAGAVFTDIITSEVTRSTYDSIGRIYEMGVAKGLDVHQFGPNELVTRAQMASFITRALAHTAARPAGISIQNDTVELGQQTVELVISLRDPTFQPLVGQSVDVFSSTDADSAFGEDGTCATAGDASPALASGGGPSKCAIDFGDLQTGPSGDVTGLSIDLQGADRTVWAWSGAIGDTFNSEETTSSIISIAYTKPVVKVVLTDDLSDNQQFLKFGDSVTFTWQAADEDDNPVAESGYKIPITATTYAVGGGGGSAGRTYTTDEDGKVELTFTQEGTSAANETARVTLSVGAITGPAVPSGQTWTVTDKATNKMIAADAMIPDPDDTDDSDGQDMMPHPDAGRFAARWSEASAVATTLKLENPNSFVLASNEGDGAGNALTATLTDQYGDGVGGGTVFFRSTDPLGLGARGGAPQAPVGVRCAVLMRSDRADSNGSDDDCWVGAPRNNHRRTTNAAGLARFSYNRDSEDKGEEWLWATYSSGSGEDAINLVSERLYQYWAEEAAGSASGPILEADTDNNQILIYDEGPTLINYDGNDQLINLDGPGSFAAFGKQLDRADDADPPTHVAVGAYKDKVSEVSKITLERKTRISSALTGDLAEEIAGSLGLGADVDASDGGVIVIGNGTDKVWVFDGADDEDPQELTETATENYGWDVAISNDGATIVVGDPGASSNVGAVYVYTRDDDGAYAKAATLTDTMNGPGESGTASATDGNFGESVDISGDGTTIVGIAPDDARDAGSETDGKIYSMPDGGWIDNATPDHTISVNAVTGGRGVSISDDGTVIAIGVFDQSNGDGGVMLAQASSGAWSATAANAAVALDVSGDDEFDSARGLGANVKISGDGTVVAIPGSPRLYAAGGDNYREVVYLFTAPEDGTWAAANTGYARLTLPGLLNGAELSPGAVPSEGIGRRFAEWVDVNSNGGEVITGSYLRPNVNNRGTIVLFTRDSSDGTYNVERQYMGAGPNTGFGRFGAFSGDNYIVGVDRFGAAVSRLVR